MIITKCNEFSAKKSTGRLPCLVQQTQTLHTKHSITLSDSSRSTAQSKCTLVSFHKISSGCNVQPKRSPGSSWMGASILPHLNFLNLKIKCKANLPPYFISFINYTHGQMYLLTNFWKIILGHFLSKANIWQKFVFNNLSSPCTDTYIENISLNLMVTKAIFLLAF